MFDATFSFCLFSILCYDMFSTECYYIRRKALAVKISHDMLSCLVGYPCMTEVLHIQQQHRSILTCLIHSVKLQSNVWKNLDLFMSLLVLLGIFTFLSVLEKNGEFYFQI